MNMSGYNDENQHVVFGPGNAKGDPEVGCEKIAIRMVQARKALSIINQNIIRVDERAAFSQRNGVSTEIPPAHQPNARRFAQQMSSNQTQSSLPEGAGDSHVLDETDRTEVEMVDVNDNIENIGVPNNNHLSVTEYVDELYAFYKNVETLSWNYNDYMSQQADINDKMRAVLVDWLIEVHKKFELMEETLYLTVNLIDRFLAIEQVVRTKLQLVGATAMLLASKYEEVTVPVAEELLFISDNAFSRRDLLDMEKLMVKTLQFNMMSVPTPYVFMKRFLKAAESDEKMELLAFYMMELSLVEYEMIKFAPSKLAAAAVFAAECALSGHPRWTMTCQQSSSYSTDDLVECAKMMVRLHQQAATGKLKGVYRKYSTSKYGNTTKYEPAYFLLEDNTF